MPRGVRRTINYDSELAEIDRKIAVTRTDPSTEDRRKEIAEQQQRADFEG